MVIRYDTEEGDKLKLNGDMWRNILDKIEKEMGPLTIKNDFSAPRDNDSKGMFSAITRSQFDIGETRINIRGLVFENDNTAVSNIIIITAGHNKLIDTDIQASYIKCSQIITSEDIGKVFDVKTADDVIYIIDEKDSDVYNIKMQTMDNVIITKNQISFNYETKYHYRRFNINRITGRYNGTLIPKEEFKFLRGMRSTVAGQCEKVESLKPKF